MAEIQIGNIQHHSWSHFSSLNGKKFVMIICGKFCFYPTLWHTVKLWLRLPCILSCFQSQTKFVHLFLLRLSWVLIKIRHHGWCQNVTLGVKALHVKAKHLGGARAHSLRVILLALGLLAYDRTIFRTNQWSPYHPAGLSPKFCLLVIEKSQEKRENRVFHWASSSANTMIALQ